MRVELNLGMALAVAVLTGCAGAPEQSAARDVAFVRGCWVEKDKSDGRVNAFLRLLPDGANSADYTGHLQYVRGVKPGPEIIVSIARDGTRASVTHDGNRVDVPVDPTAAPIMEDGSHRVMFAGTANGRFVSIVAAGKDDRLVLGILNGMSNIGFNGERDGCD